MQGLMMDTPLTLTPFLERGRRLYPRKPIVSRAGPELLRTTYGEWAARVSRLASALRRPCAARPAPPAISSVDLEQLRPHVARWALPDDVVLLDALPRTSVGKFDKKALRARFASHVMPAPAAEPPRD